MTSENNEVPIVYFEDAYIATKVVELTSQTPAFKFEYKPLNVFQAAQLTDAIMDAGKYEKVVLANLDLMTRHLISWDVKKPDGSIVDFTCIEELKRLSPKLVDLVLQEIRKDSSNSKEDEKIAESVGN